MSRIGRIEETQRAFPRWLPAVPPQVLRAFWTLSDQAVVSIGSFALSVLLARRFVPVDYGTYALLVGGMLMLQMALASLVFHPLSIFRSMASEERRSRYTWTSLVIAGLLCLPLAAILAAGLLSTGRTDLIGPALCYFLSWQVHEAARRNLLTDFRFWDALPGDVIGYPGQAIVALGLFGLGDLTLRAVLMWGSATFLIGSAAHFARLELKRGGVSELLGDARAFWATGRWSLLSNALSFVRLMVSPWTLAFLHGPAATGMLQAASNLVAVTNPIVTGLCNVVPQTAARERHHGIGRALRASASYGLVGLPLIALTYGVAFAFPEQLLQLVYGGNSPYAAFSSGVRILVVGAFLTYTTELICAFFHGIDQPRTAFLTNAAGAAAAGMLAFPMIWLWGATGACWVVAATSAVRLITACLLLSRMMAHDAR